MTMGKTFGITVVIPAYARYDALLDAIESVTTTAIEQVEIVVVDDCSPNLMLAEKLPACNSSGVPVRVYRLAKNSGPQSARNLGVRRARFSFVAFLDSDDRFAPEKMDFLLGYLKQGTCDIVYHPVDTPTNINAINARWYAGRLRHLPFKYLLAALNPVYTPCLAVRRNLGLGVPLMRYCEDYAYLLNINARAKAVHFVPLPMTTLSRAPGSTGGLSSALFKMRMNEFRAKKVMLRHWRFYGIGCLLISVVFGCLRILSDVLKLRYFRK